MVRWCVPEIFYMLNYDCVTDLDVSVTHFFMPKNPDVGKRQILRLG